jgi:hypothetical protein
MGSSKLTCAPTYAEQVGQAPAPQAELLAVCGTSAEAAAWDACQAPVCLQDVEQVLQRRQPQVFQEYQVGLPTRGQGLRVELGLHLRRCL